MEYSRASRACTSCRDRKRKCNGELPCSYCTRTNHECFYQQKPRARPHARNRLAEDPSGKDSHGPPSVDRQTQLQLLEANSPAVFVKRLAARGEGETFDPALPLHPYAYNLGFDPELDFLPNVVGLTDLLTLGEMTSLASIYFAQVTPVYDFLDRAEVEEAMVERWNDPVSCGAVDSLLLGIAALGCLFDNGRQTKGSELERQLVYSARVTLEYSSQLPHPHVDHVVGWLLRVIYLRVNSTPHATWMASCTLMHMIETSKMHFDTDTNSYLAQQSTSEGCSSERRRKVYHVARLFNTWVSLDFGKSQVDLRGASVQLPQTGWTTEQRELYLVSMLLTSPGHYHDLSELEGALRDVCAMHPPHPMLQLLQCNITLCIFRRAFALGRSLPAWALDTIMDLMRASIGVVESLVAQSSPWWHVLNIPFQIACTLLVIDRPQALDTLEDTLQILRIAASHYQTQTAREAYEIALSLVQQQRDRRAQGLSVLDKLLQVHGHR
ncbi:hypothetical protein BO86DRAFT_434916 [Aspergillus japonicus CBS 114.51]|uniref:Zn(2)-C6 fungal-type domain-containing protein n=1 Tax=Aspergillus japonicus CBS 114.51 TaxID=1448312 RepID=A0A8T8XD87_ASPJA|nr:hypothetical protein BO86DRAFT_434916 [Aspergillus japonicus CBS 114.51]RAH86246.1 hypothetical protein BO86DRAFT_434916 [Aspergillus japonicus CBS 114.51]